MNPPSPTGPLLSPEQEAEIVSMIIKGSMCAIKRPAAEEIARNISEVAAMLSPVDKQFKISIQASHTEIKNVIVNALAGQVKGFNPDNLAENIAPIVSQAFTAQKSQPTADQGLKQGVRQSAPPAPPKYLV